MNKYSTEIIYENIERTKENKKKLNIIHFNDVYNIESRDVEPAGGSARFITAIEDLINQNEPTLVLFSGDAISPSSSKYFSTFSLFFAFLNNIFF
jgi:5'-nucleotidase